MEQFPLFLNLRGRPVLLVGSGEAADAKARLIERAGGVIMRDVDVAVAQNVRIAFVADDDADAAARRAADLRTAGMLVNVVDQPALCDFTTPAIVDRAPVTIAIGTAGASAGLAKALRQRIEAQLPASVGALAAALASERRAIRARWPGAADRRRAIDTALLPGGPLDPFADGASDAVAQWLAGEEKDSRSSSLVAIRITSDDPDDLTLRAARMLGQADFIYHAPDVAAAILDRARADAVRIAADTPPERAGAGLRLWLHRADKAKVG